MKTVASSLAARGLTAPDEVRAFANAFAPNRRPKDGPDPAKELVRQFEQRKSVGVPLGLIV